MKILNLTQHKASREQIAQGVVDHEFGDWLTEKLTFYTLPVRFDVTKVAKEIAYRVAEETDFGEAMIGGAPFLMPALEKALGSYGIKSLYAFSQLVTTGNPGEGKISQYIHKGFVWGTL